MDRPTLVPRGDDSVFPVSLASRAPFYSLATGRMMLDGNSSER